MLGYGTDLIPGKNLIVMQYVDGPGRMGKIGTVLGQAGVNVETMQIAVKEDSDVATVFMNVDRAVNGRVQTDLKNVVDAVNAWFIEL